MTDAARRSEAAPPGARVTSTLSAGGAGLHWGRRGVVIALTDNTRPKSHLDVLFTLRPAAPKVFTRSRCGPANTYQPPFLAGYMQIHRLTQSAALALLLAGTACARNNTSNDTGAATRDTASTAISDSARGNQTESGVTDSSGQSTLGPGVEKTRPDQGQPVTSKGDTVNTGVDSATTSR